MKSITVNQNIVDLEYAVRGRIPQRASVLKKEASDYYLVTPVEKIKITVENHPFVVTQWHWQENSVSGKKKWKYFPVHHLHLIG